MTTHIRPRTLPLMSRPLRIEFEGAWYHVMNRGRGRQTTFPGERGYALFVDTLAEAAERFGVEVHAYCLMPNHYHLFVRTPRSNLARAMRHVDGIYTQRHNRLMQTDGPLFRGRYKAILVEADAYLLSVSRYIHRNPIDARCPLVERLQQWPWSSYPEYVGAREAPDWLIRRETYAALDGTDQHRKYRRFVEAGVDEEVAAFYARQRQAPILGSESFQERVLSEARTLEEVPRYERRRWHSAETVIGAVADHYAIAPTELTAGGGQHGEARGHAMWLCQESTALTLREIGAHFGVGYSAVGQQIRRTRRRVGVDALRAWGRIALSRLDP